MKTTQFDKYKHNFNPWVTKGIRLSIKHCKIKKPKNDRERNKLDYPTINTVRFYIK